MAETEPTVEQLTAQLASAQARIKEVNAEAQGHRLSAAEAKKAHEAATAELARVRAEHDGLLTAAQQRATDAAAAAEKARADAATATAALSERATQRVINAELRAAAARAGIVDLDAVKLFDASAIKAAEDGSVTIPDDFFAKAKEAKPYLFGAPPADTSSRQKPPPAEPPKVKHAREWTPEERIAFEKKNGLA